MKTSGMDTTPASAKDWKIRPPRPGEAPAGDPARMETASAAALRNVLFFMAIYFRYPEAPVYAEIKRHLPTMEGFFMAYAKQAPRLPAASDLASEYIGLFVNNKGFVPAVPYASCHLDNGQLMGDAFFRLRQMMAATGLMIDGSVRELEDHLSILLEYNAGLIGRLLEAERGGGSASDDDVGALFTVTFDYIGPVVRSMLPEIERHAKLDFYRTGARCLDAFIRDAEVVYEQVLGLTPRA